MTAGDKITPLLQVSIVFVTITLHRRLKYNYNYTYIVTIYILSLYCGRYIITNAGLYSNIRLIAGYTLFCYLYYNHFYFIITIIQCCCDTYRYTTVNNCSRSNIIVARDCAADVRRTVYTYNNDTPKVPVSFYLYAAVAFKG